MTVTTAVLILAGFLTILFSSTMRPEPIPKNGPDFEMPNPAIYDNQDLKDFIKSDRKEGDSRLLVTLICVGVMVEVAVFLITYSLSQKIVETVRDSYELKTPLAIIQANMEALDVDKEGEKWKTNIENEVSHANKLVLDLLQLARMDAKTSQKALAEEIDLKKEIEERVEIFKPKFSGKIFFKSNAEKTTHLLQKQDVLQILDILLDNATKYGNKKISILLEKNGLAISNDGAKISKEEQKKVFDRFYQTDKSKEGSGLGLAIAKALCEQNGWDIHCESKNHNTKFTLVF